MNCALDSRAGCRHARFLIDGRPVALPDIRVPLFAVSTEQDHVAPLHSVFKLHPLIEPKSILSSQNGGHNAGILSEPGQLSCLRHAHFIAKNTSGLPQIGAIEIRKLAQSIEVKNGNQFSADRDELVFAE
jgi:hypothetical protein